MLSHAPQDQEREPVTRTEVVAAVKSAFDSSGATGAQLVAVAMAADARDDLIAALRRVPQRAEFRHIRELWPHLSEMPVK